MKAGVSTAELDRQYQDCLRALNDFLRRAQAQGRLDADLCREFSPLLERAGAAAGRLFEEAGRELRRQGELLALACAALGLRDAQGG